MAGFRPNSEIIGKFRKIGTVESSIPSHLKLLPRGDFPRSNYPQRSIYNLRTGIVTFGNNKDKCYLIYIN